jgi:hypothetical protein
MMNLSADGLWAAAEVQEGGRRMNSAPESKRYPPRHTQTPEAILAPKVIGSDGLSRCQELGGAFAAGLAMAVF